MSLRRSPLGLFGALVGAGACVPEPASMVEIRQTLAEVVDQGRAMAIERALIELCTNVDPADDPAALAEAVMKVVADTVPCAVLEPSGETGVRIDFGPQDAACTYANRGFAGALRVTFSEPTPGAPLASISFVDLVSEGSAVTGTTQVTWGPDDTRRVVSEIRLDSASQRQIEIQSDWIQRPYRGALQIDGWLRWQTLMGRWHMEVGGWEHGRDALVPTSGLATVSTPYDHDIVLDFTGELDEGLEVRANGGRSDVVFAVAPDGEVLDLESR